MSEHKVTLRWERGGAEFVYQKYPRDHTWSFDGGHTMTATAAPAYLGNPANVDPEEAFVASLSSCHMLTFLAIASKQKFVLDDYTDEAVGHMEKNAEGRLAITRVELHPKITWSGEKKPTAEELDKRVHVGQPAYGMDATGSGKASDGSKALLESMKKEDGRPLWICI